MNFKSFCFPGALLVLFSCSDGDAVSLSEHPIAIHPSIQTRASETSFEEDDRIGVNIMFGGEGGEVYKSNAQLVHNGEYFIAEDIKWYSGDKEATFQAYYPFSAEYSRNFSVLEDQTAEGYFGSDLLLALADNVKPNLNGVSLSFVHAMTQIVVLIQNYSDYEITAVRINNTKGDVTINHESRSVTVKVTAMPVEIEAQKATDNAFRAIIAPQQEAIEIVLTNDAGIDISKTFETVNFKGGTRYNANIVVTNDFDITDYDITSDGKIDGWEDGGALPGN